MNAIARTCLLLVLLVAISAHATAALADAELSVSDDSIAATDRLTLNIAFTLEPGAAIKPWAAAARSALEAAGWTVLSIDQQPPAIATDSDSPGSLVHSAIVVVEPFLPGQYTIPPISASIIPPPDSTESQVDLTTPMRTIEVTSLLPEDEPARLPLPITDPAQQNQTDQDDNADAPLGSLRPVPPEPDKSNTLLLIGGAAASLAIACAAVVVGFKSARQIRSPKPTDHVRALEKLANSKSPDLAAIDRNVRTLAAKPGPEAPALLALLTDLESIRYGPDADSIPAQQRSTIAKQAAVIAKRLRKSGPAGGAQ